MVRINCNASIYAWTHGKGGEQGRASRSTPPPLLQKKSKIKYKKERLRASGKN